MAAGARDIDIRLQIRANTAEGRRELERLRQMLGRDLPDSAGRATTSISALKVAFGTLIADGVRAAGRALKDFGAESIAEFRSWEDTMTGVAKTTGLPKEAIAELGDSLRGIAADIGPIVAQDIGKVAEVAGQLGVASDQIKVGNYAAAIKEISGFSETIAKAAIALPGFTGGAEQIATMIAKQLNLYKASTDSAEAFLSTMNALSNTTAANEAQIGEFLSGFTSAEALDIAQEKAAAIGATFISLGQDAQASATRFTSGMSRLVTKGFSDANKLIAESETAIQALEKISGKTLEEVGTTGELLMAALNADIAEATLVVADSLGQVENAADRLEKSNEIFGKVGGRVMMAMADNLGLYQTNLQTAQQATKDATDGVSSIQQEFEVALAKQGVAFDELKSKVTDVKIEVGKHLTGALADLIRTDISPLVEDFGAWLKTSEGAQEFFATTLPDAVKLTSAAIRGLAEAGAEAYEFIKTGSDAIGTLIGDIETGQITLDDVVGTIGESIGITQKQASTAAAEIKKYWDALPETIGALSHPWETLKLAGSEAWEVLKDKGETALKSLKTAVTGAKDAIIQPFRDAKAEAAAAFQEIVAGVESGVETIKIKVAEIQDAIVAPFKNAKNEVAGVMDEIKYAVSGDKLELEFDAAGALETLKKVQGKHGQIIKQNERLNALYKQVWKGMQTAIEANREPSQKLKEHFIELQEELTELGRVAYARSVFPDIQAWLRKDAAEADAFQEGIGGATKAVEDLGTATEETKASSADFVALSRGLADNLGALSGGLGKLGGLFGISELGGLGSILGQAQQFAQIPALLDDMGGALSGVFSDLGGLLGGGGGLGGILSSLTGGLGGLGGALSSVLPMLGPIGLAGGAIALAWGPLKGMFKSIFGEAKSEGNLAAESFRQYVASNISGGGEMSVAMQEMYGQMKASGFDYGTFLNQVGSESHDALGGFSEDWDQGSTSLDQFAVAIGTATGNMEKAPQVALQTVAAMDSMGMSTEEVTAKVEEMTQSILGTGSIGTESMDMLSQSYVEQIPNIEQTFDATESLRKSIEEIPREIEIQTTFLGWEGNAPPGMASGGVVSGGLAFVGERGPEGAIFPGGGRGIVGMQGTELGLFPAGTQIVPNSQLSAFMRSIPRMAAGGTVQAAPLIGGLTINVYTQEKVNERKLADYVMQEIARKVRPYMR